MLAMAPLSAIAGSTGSSEVYPGSFEAAPPGVRIASVYLYKRKLEGFYLHGRRMGGSTIEGEALVSALTAYGRTGDLTSSWSLVLPYLDGRRTAGVLPPGFGEKTAGFGELRLAYTVWPINDPSQGHFLAVSGTLMAPTGYYDHSQALNASDNRWKGTLQVGWVRYLSSTVAVELIPEVTVYGKNDDYVGFVMKQAPAAALSGFLRWKFAPGWETFAGFQANGGGEQTIAGMKQDNEPRNQRVFLGASTALSPTMKLGLRYSRDASVRYELKATNDIVTYLNWAF